MTIGQAEQRGAPALLASRRDLRATWSAADGRNAHHAIINISSAEPSPATVLPFQLERPFEQHLFLGLDGNVHLVWLAAEEGETRLFSAFLTPQLAVDRGPIPVSDQPTLRYTAAPDENGSVRVVWSGGLPAEPGLQTQLIDRAGRPRDLAHLQADADWPVLIHINGRLELFWLQPSTGRVFRAALQNSELVNSRPLAQSVALGPGDRLVTFDAGADASHGYLIWNITRADGNFETWWTAGELAASQWPRPVRLGIETDSSSAFETSFNAGVAQAARAGEIWLSWASPLRTQSTPLPIAIMNPDEQLGILYFQGGQIAGYQTIAATDGLIGPPTLASDRNRHLYLAWSEPTRAGIADLKLTLTRQFD